MNDLGLLYLVSVTENFHSNETRYNTFLSHILAVKPLTIMIIKYWGRGRATIAPFFRTRLSFSLIYFEYFNSLTKCALS